MDRATSIYLDIVRFLAAITVFIVHASYERFTDGELPFLWRISHLGLWPIPYIGNDAVMVFFVLSGFVIAYVANTKEKTIEEYFLSRFARLYSVVFPALIITVCLDYFGSNVDFSVYDGGWYQSDMPLVRILTNLFFVNELWFSSIRPFSNGPFWSIGYEFWYYVLFAIAFYLKKPFKYFLFVLVCLLVGPKILLLAPVWLLGVLAYYISSKNYISESVGWILFVISIVGYLLYRVNGGNEYVLELTRSWLGEDNYESLLWSKYFLSSYIIGVFITINFIAVTVVSTRVASVLILIESPVRFLASYTFILYLLHYPLLQFFTAISHDIQSEDARRLLVILGTIVTIWVLGYATEKQKHNYKKLFRAASCRLKKRSIQSS